MCACIILHWWILVCVCMSIVSMHLFVYMHVCICAHVSCFSVYLWSGQVGVRTRLWVQPDAWPKVGHGACDSHITDRAVVLRLWMPWLMFCVLLPSNGNWLTQSLDPHRLWWLAETKQWASLPNQKKKNLPVPWGFGHGLQSLVDSFLLHFTSLSVMFTQNKVIEKKTVYMFPVHSDTRFPHRHCRHL